MIPLDNFSAFLKLFALPALLFLWITTSGAAAPPPTGQTQGADYFVYTVQPGDALILVALRYQLKLADIVLANNLIPPNLIFPGQQLILPGVPASPPAPAPASPPANRTHTVQPGDTLFKIANFHQVPVETIITANHLTQPDLLQIGQLLEIPGSVLPPMLPQPLPAPFVNAELSEPIIIQGRALVVRLTLSEPARLSGTFEGQTLIFSERGHNEFWGLAAMHALLEPDVYPIRLTANLANGVQATTLVNLIVVEGPYGAETIRLDDSRSGLLDPELIRAEQEKLMGLWSQASPEPYWTGSFWYPVEPGSLRITSHFGARRNYNAEFNTSFHAGTDLGGNVGAPIYAPAAGKVVLAEKLLIRGNAVLIDHGLGLFSGYWHQNELAVVEGQEVQAGDLIGYIGNTGLVTGPHLHWEMRLNGIAIEPLQWVQETIP